jgi:hypothetical protein
VRARSPFAEYRLHAIGRRSADRVRALPEFERARALIDRVYAHERLDLAPLLAEHEPCYAEAPAADELHERLAWLLTRGLLELETIPLDPLCSELPELPDVVLEHEPVENQIDDGVSVIAEGTPEPAMTYEVACEITPRPVLEHGCDVVPPPAKTA